MGPPTSTGDAAGSYVQSSQFEFAMVPDFPIFERIMPLLPSRIIKVLIKMLGLAPVVRLGHAESVGRLFDTTLRHIFLITGRLLNDQLFIFT